MLRYYAKRSHKESYTQTNRPYEYTNWIDADSVTQDELLELSRRYRLDVNIMNDVRDMHELPRIEYGSDGTI